MRSLNALLLVVTLAPLVTGAALAPVGRVLPTRMGGGLRATMLWTPDIATAIFAVLGACVLAVVTQLVLLVRSRRYGASEAS